MTNDFEDVNFRKRLFENSLLPIVVMDAVTYQFIDCNMAAANIYRYTSPELLQGKTPLDFSAPVQYDGTPSAEKADFYIKKAIQDGSVVFEWKHLRTDGEVWDAEVQLIAFQIDDKKFLQFSLIDITERKRFDEVLRASERRFKALVQNATDSFNIINKDGIQIYVSDVAEKMLGFKQEELINIPVIEKMIHDEDKSRVEEAFKKVIREGSALTVQMKINIMK